MVVAVLVAVLVASTGVAAVTGAGATDAGARPAAVEGGLAGQTEIADQTVLAADVAADGDAAWRVSYQVVLETQNDTDAFEALRADIEADRTAFLDRFRDRIERTVGAAENATGRSMTARNFSVEVRRQSQPNNDVGVVIYRFEWTGFAVSEGDQLRVGDAVDGLILDRSTALRLGWPADYGVVSVAPAPTDREATATVWRGPEDFEARQPRVVVERGRTPAPGGATDPDGASGGATGLVVGALVLAALAVGGLLYRRGRPSDDGPTPTGGDGGTGPGAGSGASGGAAAGAGADTPDEPPEELLSNEERVLRLLRDNGGRMKQAAVAEELDWTAAKTSQVVGDLRDDDEVEAFRLGRENVLTLPDVEIDAGGEPDADGKGSDS